jgi:SAM-dependent methyltransferase
MPIPGKSTSRPPGLTRAAHALHDNSCFGYNFAKTISETAETPQARECQMTPRVPAASFYDSLASDYHKLYRDWTSSSARHGDIISRLLIQFGITPANRPIADVACGIGTQTLGMARAGWSVMASDVSSTAVARAREEASRLDLNVEFAVGDMCRIALRNRSVNAVLCFDNSLAYLTSESDVLEAALSARRVLADGGLYIGSLRDYEAIRRSAAGEPAAYADDYGRIALSDKWYSSIPTASLPTVSVAAGVRTISFQIWHWAPDFEHYDMELFLIEGDSVVLQTSVRKTVMRGWRQATISDIFMSAGFVAVRWLTASDTGFYQPICVAFTAVPEN